MLLRLPKSKSDLDSLISIMNANNTLKNNVMCEQHKVTLPSYSSDVVEYVKILNPLLDNTSNCKRVCLDFGNDINPICALLIEANSIFYNLLKQYNQNSNQVENIDSAKALEQNSDVDKTTIITTKGITDNLKKEVINTISKDNITKSHNVNNNSLAVTNDSNIAGSVNSIHDETKVQKQVVEQNSTSTTTSIDKKDDESLINVNVNSAEITDDDIDGDYNVEKQTSKNPDNITETKIIPSTKGTIPSEPTDKVVLVVDEDNAKEAVNEPETPETKKIEKPEVTVEQSSTKKEKTRPSKTSKTTEIEIKEKSKLGNNLDETLPPPLKNPPVADVPNIDTLEGDNNAAVNNDEEEAFSSNVDNRNYKQQGDDPGESLLDPQENTPYVIPDGFEEAEDSHFFTYFVIMFVVCIVMYLVFYNKRKLLALALEGRHAGNRRSRSRRGGTYSRVNTGFDESKEHLLY
ncbi:hypothetical protein M8J76_010524 [Diaphorina citri]|nr:hypothetical protein M8J76_010524 [Diaphorina citri]